MSYDRKCLELAQHFLYDVASLSLSEHTACSAELAQEIQDVIESYLEQMEAENGLRASGHE